MFVLAYNNADNDANRVDDDSFKKYFLLKLIIENYNIITQLNNMEKSEKYQQDKVMII